MLMIPTITLWQPWASLAGLEKKQNETRSWAPSYRGPFAIHAAKSAPAYAKELAITDKTFNNALTGKTELDLMIWPKLPFGAVIAVCTLADCVKITPQFVAGLTDQERAFGDYTLGRYAWKLKDVARLKTPIPAKGQQGLWKWDATEHQVTIDPWVVGDTKIWTPRGIVSGRRVEAGTEDAVMGLEVAA